MFNRLFWIWVLPWVVAASLLNARTADPFGPSFAATYEEIIRTFSNLMVQYPGAIRKRVLIQTPEKRELAIYSLGNEKARRRTLLLCNHHGDEQWVAQLCLDFVKFILWSKEDDLLVTEILRDSVVDVLPLGNPDGFAKKDRFNSRHVDINRNFPFMWGYLEPGTVNPNPGPFAMSEPETKALHDYQKEYDGQWIVVLNYHLRYPNSDGQNYILTPWAYTRKKTLTEAEMEHYSVFLPSKTEAPTFKVDTVPNVFYPCSGVHTDWSYNAFGAPALTMELGHGYDLPSRDLYLRKHLKGENLPVFLRFLKGVRETLKNTPHDS